MSTRLSVVLQPPLDALLPDCGPEFHTEANLLLDAIRAMCADSAPSRQQILRDDQMSPFVHVFLNGKQVLPAAVTAQPIRDGDEVCLLTAIRGG